MVLDLMIPPGVKLSDVTGAYVAGVASYSTSSVHAVVQVTTQKTDPVSLTSKLRLT